MQELVIDDKLQRFINGLDEGLGIVQAGKAAGYSNPYRDAMPYVDAPAVRKMVRQKIRGRIDLEASPAAYRVMLSILLEKTSPSQQRIEIAKFLIAHSLPAPKAKESPDDDENQKSARDMTNDELRAILSQSEDELASRAIPVNVAQSVDSVI